MLKSLLIRYVHANNANFYTSLGTYAKCYMQPFARRISGQKKNKSKKSRKGVLKYYIESNTNCA